MEPYRHHISPTMNIFHSYLRQRQSSPSTVDTCSHQYTLPSAKQSFGSMRILQGTLSNTMMGSISDQPIASTLLYSCHPRSWKTHRLWHIIPAKCKTFNLHAHGTQINKFWWTCHHHKCAPHRQPWPTEEICQPIHYDGTSTLSHLTNQWCKFIEIPRILQQKRLWPKRHFPPAMQQGTLIHTCCKECSAQHARNTLMLSVIRQRPALSSFSNPIHGPNRKKTIHDATVLSPVSMHHLGAASNFLKKITCITDQNSRGPLHQANKVSLPSRALRGVTHSQ